MGHNVRVEVGGWFHSQRSVDSLEMRPEKVIELIVVIRLLILTEPPEPITPLRYVERLEGIRRGLRRSANLATPPQSSHTYRLWRRRARGLKAA